MSTRFQSILKIILPVLAGLFTLPTFATQPSAAAITISGTVTDGSGSPLDFALVRVEGTDRGAFTDESGNYTLRVSTGSHNLIASLTGYHSLEYGFYARRDTTINFTLIPDAVQLDGVEVIGQKGSEQTKRTSYAVNALDVKPIAASLTNISNLVDRSTGIRIRREGGLGSDFDLSINGLSGNSVRYFLDGVPLDTKGADFKLDNLPVNLINRVEIYKGVVPAYLSADALGGAINIITNRGRSNFLDLSYGIGSFHTQSVDLNGQMRLGKTAIVVRPTLGINWSKNDYTMHDVEIWSEEQHKYINSSRKRFHDDYFSLLAQIEAGVQNVSWADAFFISGSFSKVNKELQTGAMQNKVYGMAERHSHAWNASARYNKRFEDLYTHIDLSHTWDTRETVDTAYRKYSWDGSWLPSSGNEITGGEKSIRVYKRPLTVVSAGADYDFGRSYTVSVNYMLNRTGNERYDKVSTQFEPTNDHVTKQIISLTLTQRLLNGRLVNTLFGKDYINGLAIKQSDHPTTDPTYEQRNKTKSYYGGGVGSRFSLSDPVSVKASYEHSVRLPSARELLGNGTTVMANTGLSPETSNNYNASLFGNIRIDSDNLITYEAGGFIRHVQNYIRAAVSEREGVMQYENIPAVHIKGIDLEATYTWRRALQVSFNGSYNDSRNLKKLKSDGKPSATYKNRVPNRPWMFANASVAYTWRNTFMKTDRLRLCYDWQWVHWYYLNWEAFGAASSKARIPNQNSSNITVTYGFHDRYSISVEFSDIFNARLYDNYMLQKPGRGVFAKFNLTLK